MELQRTDSVIPLSYHIIYQYHYELESYQFWSYVLDSSMDIIIYISICTRLLGVPGKSSGPYSSRILMMHWMYPYHHPNIERVVVAMRDHVSHLDVHPDWCTSSTVPDLSSSGCHWAPEAWKWRVFKILRSLDEEELDPASKYFKGTWPIYLIHAHFRLEKHSYSAHNQDVNGEFGLPNYSAEAKAESVPDVCAVQS